MNKPEWFQISTGCITSVITGSALPIYGLVFGDIIGVSNFNKFENTNYANKTIGAC